MSQNEIIKNQKDQNAALKELRKTLMAEWKRYDYLVNTTEGGDCLFYKGARTGLKNALDHTLKLLHN